MSSPAESRVDARERKYARRGPVAAYPLKGAAALIASLLATHALAQTWSFIPRLDVEETFTNNVNLEPSSQRQSDAVTQVTPSLLVKEQGAHSELTGSISLPFVVYARTTDNDQFYPSVSLLGNVNFLDKFLVIEGSVSIAQQFLSPFGAQPSSLSNFTQNRYQSNTYRVSPYIQGTTANNTKYEVRNDNIWTNLSGAPLNVSNERYNAVTATASNMNTQLGWKAEADYNTTTFNDQSSIVMRLARFQPVYSFDQETKVNASVGYEDNDFQLTESRDVIYGVGFEWHPTPRTNVTGFWEHRFFGSSYNFTFDHHTALTMWGVQASRNITTYPQQLGTIPAGVDVPAFLNTLFASVTDPAARQQLVNQLIQNRGLPSSLTGPVPIYAEQVLLQQQASATVGILGARNTILATVYNLKTEPIAGTGQPLPPIFQFGNQNTQTGVGVVWTHNLAPSWILSGNVNVFRTTANPPFEFKTRQGIVSALLTHSFGPNTSVYTGARYQASSSDLPGSDYNEAAVYIGVHYTYR